MQRETENKKLTCCVVGGGNSAHVRTVIQCACITICCPFNCVLSQSEKFPSMFILYLFLGSYPILE